MLFVCCGCSFVVVVCRLLLLSVIVCFALIDDNCVFVVCCLLSVVGC